MHTNTTPLQEVYKLISELSELKLVFRNTQTAIDRKESTAEHSWSASMIVMIAMAELKQEFDEINELKAIKLALIHDLVEIYAGDVIAFDVEARKNKEKIEEEALKAIMALYPAFGNQLHDLWHEFERKETLEAKIAKAADAICPIFQRLHAKQSYTPYNITVTDLEKIKYPSFAFSQTFYALYQQLKIDLIKENLIESFHSPSWPNEWEQGVIKTQNAMGVMFKELSPAAEAFVRHAKIAKLPLLDIGAAYGVATIPALENGANVIACDLSEEHLSILRQSVDKKFLPNLTTLTSKFPNNLKFEHNSLSAILLSNVLHFMDGPTVVAGLKQCWEWLEKNGKLYITVMTPHLSFYHQLIPVYEQRVSAGEQWPGIFDPQLVAAEKWQDNLPDFVHLFEINTVQAVVKAAGFKIDAIDYFCYKNYSDAHRTDGKEFISLCATK